MGAFVKSRSEITIGTGTNATPTEPSRASAGNLLVGFVFCASAGTLGLPTGWTSITSGTQTSIDWLLGYIIRDTTAPSYTFTTGSSVYRECNVVCIEGQASGPNPIVTVVLGSSGNAINHNPDEPAATATGPCLSLIGGINFNGATTTWTIPAGYTAAFGNQSTSDLCMASKAVAAGGSENPAAWAGVVSAGLQDYWDGFTLLIADGTPSQRSKGGRLQPAPFKPGHYHNAKYNIKD